MSATETPLVEVRPFPPFLPPQATVMLMGTFPPAQEKRTMEFHYPNFQNDMWRVYGLVFFNDPAHFQRPSEKAFDAEKIKAFLAQRGIASCPTVYKAIRGRGNASDAFLQVVEPVDLHEVLRQIPACRFIGTTGGKATEILLDVQGGGIKMPKTGESVSFPYAGRELTLTRLPSTSRAYPLSLAKKAEAYRAFFQTAGLV
ncbi:G:T/U mismatch-specific DNA glycosylase [Kingella potus]|uniref:G:T/U mismatch-specific DNA glycosylase n=1 Tax=Kingella potus TaxID=265175 RepID=A0A377R014_9NEIS|nr:DNA glycosylase [Kingella potus]UOP01368.1 DNA glycosylase [Kingella potus]STR00320.1 G:T/U mismatch-specific DNA glycosylase [Kingella potus]